MKYALTCLAGLTAMGLVTLAPDTASAGRYYYGGGWADQGSASMSARATAMAVMLIVIAPITTIATPMGMARGGGTVTVLGLANTNFRLAKLSPFGSRAGRRECLNLACT
jgi:hypothetical protein